MSTTNKLTNVSTEANFNDVSILQCEQIKMSILHDKVYYK